MANVLFCSDLHFGHKNIGKFRSPCGVTSEEENRARIKSDWTKKVTKRDIVYVLGDACFTEETLEDFKDLLGTKILIRGNHDTLPTKEYLKYFSEVYGLLKYKEFWLSHAPIHPAELRGKVNLHGHVHFSSIRTDYEEYYNEIPKIDRRYFNCCPENLWPLTGSSLISLQEIRECLKL